MKNNGALTVEQLLTDIRAHCLSCCGGSRNLVKECTAKRCRLWPHRFGRLVGVQTAMIIDPPLEGQLDMFVEEFK